MAPESTWSDKRERQYEYIIKSLKRDGKSKDQAEEIAARIVNKARREKGETKSGKKMTSGTGNPNNLYEDRSKDELYNLAKEKDISGRGQMTKQELIEALRE
jgi:hypothetical protein